MRKYYYSWVFCAAFLSGFLMSPLTAENKQAGLITNGIAERYKGDLGIQKDPDVVFAEDFEESTTKELQDRWEDDCYNDGTWSFTGDINSSTSGKQSLLMSVPGTKNKSYLFKRLLPGYDELYLRYYLKIDENCFDIHHFPWLGGMNPLPKWPSPKAGIRPNGSDKFSTGVETMGKQWRWDFYTYWYGQHDRWGCNMVHDKEYKAEKGVWTCVEFMVKMNDPVEKSNGEQAMWINGKERVKGGQVISRFGEGFPKGAWKGAYFIPDAGSDQAFEGFRWRTSEKLKINYVWLELYITKAPKDKLSKVWFDDLVIAKKYIGPIKKE